VYLNIGRPKKNCKIRARIPPRYKLVQSLILRAREEKSLEARAKEISTPDVARKSARISSRACEKDAIRFFA
jgi:hypothetical protein